MAISGVAVVPGLSQNGQRCLSLRDSEVVQAHVGCMSDVDAVTSERKEEAIMDFCDDALIDSGDGREKIMPWRRDDCLEKGSNTVVMSMGYEAPKTARQTERRRRWINNVSLATQPRLSVETPSDRKRLA